MEEVLPPELVLHIFGLVDPLRDTAALCGTSRAWRRFMYDPLLWRSFYLHTFPPYFDSTNMPPDVRRFLGHAEEDGHDEEQEKPWRPLFEAKARQLKSLLVGIEHHKLKRKSYRGWDWRMMAAAETGCLPLVKNYADRLLELFPAPASTAAANQQQQQQSSSGAGDQASKLKRLVEINLSHVRAAPLRLVDQGLLRSTHSAPTAKFFLDLGARIVHAPPIYNVAASGNAHMVALLLTHQANDKAQPNFNCALTAAAKHGHLHIVNMMLQSNRAINIYGGSAIYCAITNSSLDVLRVLFKHGYTSSLDDVKTALCQDILSANHVEMLQLLLSGLQVKISSSASYELLTSKLMLHTASAKICTVLLAHGVDINGRSEHNGLNALHYAVKEDNVKLVECLLACGANATEKAKFRDCSVTPLSLARQKGNQDIIRLLAKPERKRRTSLNSNDSAIKKANNDEAGAMKSKRRCQSMEDAQITEETPKSEGPETMSGDEKRSQATKPKAVSAATSEQMQREQELEATVRRMAKVPYGAKLDVFTLRQMLKKKADMKAKDLPKRRADLLESLAQFLVNGSARPSLLDNQPHLQ